MNLSRKIRTLVGAQLQQLLPGAGRSAQKPAAQLAAVRAMLAEVQEREQAVAAQLKETYSRLEAASAEGDYAAEREQRRLAAELEAHLKNESTQVIELSQTLDELAAQDTPPSAAPTPDAAEASTGEAESERRLDEKDLQVRKSRLSD